LNGHLIAKSSLRSFKKLPIMSTTESSVDLQDDNKLVTINDLVDNNATAVPEKSMWSDPERLAKLQAEMKILAKARIPVEQIPFEVITQAMSEVLSSIECPPNHDNNDWAGWTSYDMFKKTIDCILSTRGKQKIPFAVKTKNQRNGQMDFWLIRVFVNIGENKDPHVTSILQ